MVVGDYVAVGGDYNAGACAGILLLGFTGKGGGAFAHVYAYHACHAVLHDAGGVSFLIGVGDGQLVRGCAGQLCLGSGRGGLRLRLAGFAFAAAGLFHYHGAVFRGGLIAVYYGVAEINAKSAAYKGYHQQAGYELAYGDSLLFLSVIITSVRAVAVVAGIVVIPVVVFHGAKMHSFRTLWLNYSM